MDESKYMIHFQLIAAAGQSKSNSLEAIKNARNGEFNTARKLLGEASEELVVAHKVEFEMLQDEANGKAVDTSIVAIHAQDHLTMATVLQDLAEDIINIYEVVSKI